MAEGQGTPPIRSVTDKGQRMTEDKGQSSAEGQGTLPIGSVADEGQR